MVGDIGINLLSDIIFLLIIGLSGWLFYLLTRRDKLLKFFGIDKSRRIVIYLSNLRIIRFGAIGIDGQKRSYQGLASAFSELRVATQLRDLFNYILPSLSENPGILSKLLISDVRVQLLPSPLEHGKLEKSVSFVTLGSPAYNIASDYVEKKLNSKARFELGSSKVAKERSPFFNHPPSYPVSLGIETVDIPSPLPSGTVSAGEYLYQAETSGSSGAQAHQSETDQIDPAIIVEGVPHLTDTTIGFVERLKDREQIRSIFYAAGISELATAGAVNFLTEEWPRLYKKYGSEEEFLIVLRFEPTDFTRWTILFEK